MSRYRLTVGAVQSKGANAAKNVPSGQTYSYTLDDLKNKFRRTEVVSSIQCGGNRRAEMSAVSLFR